MADQTAGPHLFVLLGATGDLSKRKLLPSLARLRARGLDDGSSVVLGAALDDNDKLDDAAFRELARASLVASKVDVDEGFLERLYFQRLTDGKRPDYEKLAARVAELEKQHALPGNRIFYLALPPPAFGPTAAALGEVGLARGPGWSRLVIEKPFGHDLASAQALNLEVHRHFDEASIYRIDHYLGKETVQNLIVFRFANGIFETSWNRDRIEEVQITTAEELGIEGRAGYYDKSGGAMRDMIQNHLTQMLALIAMEVPTAYSAAAIRREKLKVLESARALTRSDAVFGQYEGYRQTEGVAPDSKTETFVALRLGIDNWRWEGVPFYLRTGKHLPKRHTKIVVKFRAPPACLFSDQARGNLLVITMQPDEGFALYFQVKQPGMGIELKSEPLHFQYNEAFGVIPDGYETLLLDVVLGDQTLFVDTEGTEASWRLYAPLLGGKVPVDPYATGSWGPAGANELLARAGHHWFDV